MTGDVDVSVSSSLPATLALLLWIPFSVAVFSVTKPHKAVAFLLVSYVSLLGVFVNKVAPVE